MLRKGSICHYITLSGHRFSVFPFVCLLYNFELTGWKNRLTQHLDQKWQYFGQVFFQYIDFDPTLVHIIIKVDGTAPVIEAFCYLGSGFFGSASFDQLQGSGSQTFLAS